MQYYDDNKKQLVDVSEINISGVSIQSGSDLSEHGYYFVTETGKPNHDPIAQDIVRDISVGDYLCKKRAVITYRIVNKPEWKIEEIKSDLYEKYKSEVNKILTDALDKIAVAEGYQDIATACSYILSSNAGFKADAERFIKLRDDAWRYAIELMRKASYKTSAEETVEEVLSNV